MYSANSPVDVAFAPLDDAAVVIGVGVFRIEFDGTGVVGYGSIEIALSLLGVAALVVGTGIFRIEFDRASVVGYWLR